tara:strand:- start:156 stop:869 length:714 start_codon:yes stop_codon:yes gene_type:complete
MKNKTALLVILISTISFLGGWIYGFKRIPPSTKLSDFLRWQRQIREQSIGYNRVRLKPRYEHFKLSTPNPDIVFLGDSITESSLFNESFVMPSRIYNRGVSGDTAVDILNRLQEVIDLRPRDVYLMVGINDLAMGAKPIQVANNIEKIYDILSNKGINIHVQQTIQCQPSKCSYTREVNELNRILSSKFKFKLIDLGELTANTGLSGDLTYDGFHLNKKGYEIWITQLRKTSYGDFQ